MDKMARGFLALAFSLACAAPVTAAGLVPKKASDLRTAVGYNSSAACPLGGGFHIVDQQQNADGTGGPFSVPVGSVFVITSWEWTFCGSSASSQQSATLEASNGSTNSILSQVSGETDGSGCGAGTAQIPSGVTVKGGSTLCFGLPGSAGGVVVHGFIAKDN